MIPVVAAVVLILTAPPSQAAFTIELDQVYQGATPGGTPPWISATFDQNGADTVRLTLTSHLEAPSEFVSDWLFNLNPGKNAAALTFSLVSSTLTVNPAPLGGNNAFVLDGQSGQFDIAFHFDTSSPGPTSFGAEDVVVYDITLTGGLSESDFAFSSEGGTLQPPPFSVARVGGIGSEAENGYIRDSISSLNPVPAPPAIVLAATALVGFPFLRPWLRPRRVPA